MAEEPSRTGSPAPASMQALADLNRQLLERMMKPLAEDGTAPGSGAMLKSLTTAFAADPQRWLDIQSRYYQKQLELWTSVSTTAPDAAPPQVVQAESGDRRFRGADWQQPYWSFLAQSYLLNARLLSELVEAAELPARDKKKLSFYTRQYIDAMAPSNFPWSNPEALKLAGETGGESLAAGLRNFAGDIDRGLVSMTDETAFEVGGNLALTPGAVVYENELMQLIQYHPATDTVYERPLVIVPPCINKYYILDLQPQNSFVRYAVEQGHTVFIASWRNMPESMGTTTWDDYLQQGVMRALDVALDITGADKVNALGFCIGGTLLGSALAVRRAQGDDRVASLTLLAAMLDFCDTGEISVFVDKAYVGKRERDFANGGVMPGKELALTFASLRANDLIWQYVVNNYLKGKTPEAFDLLYWNGDSTNLPGAMYAYYVRNMYLENNLKKPGKLTMCGVPVDLRKIDMPAYVVAARDDHIVPWQTAYASARHLKGAVQFVLGASGHIAGVINPASRNRRNFWAGGKLMKDPARWLEAATDTPGSWWKHWSEWLAKQAGERIPACSTPGSDEYPEIEPAPGRYVKEKTV
ncbi:MAG TPA: class I poly(R)-hydroxyalkanoic acid synthase [Burkholderiales bacterium]|nr:class I poly(R)-hydroxyalkanoic acid synthase [Burkholderiales bacterium]